MSDIALETVSAMGTVVTVQVVGHGDTATRRRERAEAVRRATDWFRIVEVTCSRFDPRSELRALCESPGLPVAVGEILFELLAFSLEVARETAGAFDPTVGGTMEARGFDRHFRTGVRAPSAHRDPEASWRDVVLDRRERTVTLLRSLTLDLGGVAKGFAADLAGRELAPFGHYAIDAGGDQLLAGHNADGEPWRVGIRHPRDPAAVIELLTVTDVAVCTSGDYERRGAEGEHHLVDPRAGAPAAGIASATVIAPTAMAADALATAAFVLGPAAGAPMLERHGASGVWYDTELARHTTSNFSVSH